MSDLTFFTKSDGETAVSPWSELTVADGLLLLIGALAAVLRLANLGRLPLSPQEAEAALGVWHLWQADAGSIIIHSPAYFTLTALLTQILGTGDAVMRLVPACFGVGLVLLPRLLRHRLGPVGMLVTSLLLAISPLAAITSRTAGGDAIALFALLLFFSARLRYQERRAEDSTRWLYVMAGALALGFTSSALFYGGLATLLLAWGAERMLPPVTLEHFGGISPAVWRKTAVFAAVVFLALASLFLWHLPGLGGAAALLGNWLRAFGFQGGVAALVSPLLALLRYEVILLPLSVVAIAWAGRQRQPLAKFAALWLAFPLLLMALQWGHVPNAALALLPGYLLLGILADAVLQALDDWLSWLFAAGLTLIGALVFVNVARFSRAISFDATDQSNIWLALFVVLFSMVTVYFFWTWEWRATNQGLLLAALALFGFYHWGTAWWLGHQAANDVRERWVEAPATDSEVLLLAEIIHEVARQGSGDASGISLFSAVDSPVLRWYLRDFPQLQTGQTVPASAQTDLIITGTQSDLVPGSDYFGQDFVLLHSGIQPETWRGPTPVIDTLRWWLFHESNAVVTEEPILLWIRADLTQP